MVTTTVLYEHELNQPTGDGELDELLATAREETGRNYQLIVSRTTSGLIRKQTTCEYRLYVFVDGCMPWQHIAAVHTKREAFAYLFGVVNTAQTAHKRALVPLTELRLKYQSLLRDFCEVENERQDMCMLLGHHMNSGKSVVQVMRERLNASR